MSMRTWVKAATPPAIVALARRWQGTTPRFVGKPSSWSDALRMSTGYSSSDILERVLTATRAVVGGNALFERDSVLFDEPDPPFAIVAGLLRAAARSGGRLDVVDVGGSLGSTYRQCRPFLDVLHSVSWQVVEQPHFVTAGRAEFASAELGFLNSLDELQPAAGHRVVLLSSVLQYIEDPWQLLRALPGIGATELLIDRTPFSALAKDRLCIQHVPQRIYSASYPCWIFSRRNMLVALEQDWKAVSDFLGSDGAWVTDDGLGFEFRGLLLEKRS